MKRIVKYALSAIAVILAGSPGAWALPDYYPSDYQKVVDASHAEQGVLVYSNVGEMNWRPLLEKFHEIYPWIKVQTLDLTGNEVFERYYAEQATGNSEVDIVLTSSAATWLEFVQKNNVKSFVSVEDSRLPEWSKPSPGVYTISVDPQVLVYNKLLLPEAQWPRSMADVVKLAKADAPSFDKKIATPRPMGTAGSQNLLTHYIASLGEEKAFDIFKTLGPLSEIYRSAGPIMEKVTSGEYLIGYQLSGIQVFPLMNDPTRASVLGWTFPSDGTLLLMRHMAMATTVKNPNSAKLLMDFILSHDGQSALAEGGLMPYRSDVTLPDGPLGYTYQKIAQQIGEDHIIRTTFDPKLMTPSTQTVSKVKAAFNITE
ncbi:iron(III) transport system substrate-binding protein [Phyllobacterium trifolii]|uniref:Iron(III) transport system substrate-binding protein n=1 Tax=Phyllobacterium trifolii TaxID=300193 RepID=A0A839UEL7_9HYPH|nr:extracellular solute-binding protein [Phyllobacterium trifolii]MBB3146889.1 iron(III) transport system substrate-binding protein [Phyllobacterium trifolii]